MLCGCVKNLGCFTTNQIIDFGFVNPLGVAADFIFEVRTLGTFQQITVNVAAGDAVTLPFTFNEEAETLIKIKLPAGMAGPGVWYATSTDGACCFSVHGVTAVCS